MGRHHPILSVEKAERGYVVTIPRNADYPAVYAFSTLSEALNFLHTYFQIENETVSSPTSNDSSVISSG
jgi:hypothetical protein